MKILITGVAGFIGFHLAKRFLLDGYSVVGYDNLNDYYDVSLKKSRLNEINKIKEKNNADFVFIQGNLEDLTFLESIFKSHNFNCVINLAAQAGVRYSLENPHAYIQSNIVGFENIIELSKTYKVENFLYASSSSVYGGNIDMPFMEKNEVSHPISIYAATKRTNELIAHTYSHLYNLPCIGLRFFTVYGPWGRPDMALFLFTEAILKKEPIKVFNNGDMMRDFTYVDDVVESISKLIHKPAIADKNFDKKNPNPSTSWSPSRIFNIGNSNPTPLMEYISAIEDALDIKAKINYLPLQPGDVPATYADTSALEEWINFVPKTSIKNGVNNFVRWYLEFYRNKKHNN